jgi:4-methyl-5(b-hydroxyethyl)-thiazole monophosphate biosynthesis
MVMTKKVLIFLADGFEEVEALTPIDYLRRAGIEVNSVSISASKTVKGSHNIPVLADSVLSELAGLNVALWDGVLLPGGIPGAPNLAACKELGVFLRDMAGAGKLVGAICAAPAVVLAPLGLLQGRRFTCYPGMEKEVSGAQWLEEKVVQDGNIITSRGAGTAGLWARGLIGALAGEAVAQKVAASVLL